MITPEQKPFIIRNARVSDSYAINKLCVESYEQFRSTIGETNWKRLRSSLSRTSELAQEGQLIVAEDLSDLLGVVLYVPLRQGGDGKVSALASLRSLAVSPLHRGRGVGRSLTEECINRARQDGADSIALTTAEMMTVARPMYQRMGFTMELELGERFGVTHARYVLRLK